MRKSINLADETRTVIGKTCLLNHCPKKQKPTSPLYKSVQLYPLLRGVFVCATIEMCNFLHDKKQR